MFILPCLTCSKTLLPAPTQSWRPPSHVQLCPVYVAKEWALNSAPSLASQPAASHSFSFIITNVIMTLGWGLFVGLAAESCGRIWLRRLKSVTRWTRNIEVLHLLSQSSMFCVLSQNLLTKWCHNHLLPGQAVHVLPVLNQDRTDQQTKSMDQWCIATVVWTSYNCMRSSLCWWIINSFLNNNICLRL